LTAEEVPAGTTIYVDADACPVKDEIVKLAERHQVPAVFVSNAGMRLGRHPLLRNVVVPDGPDVADDWIAERAGAGDVVVTADIPLAARVLEKGAQAMSPTGKPFTVSGIGGALASRALNQHLRESGLITGGPQGFRREDRSRFLDAMDKALRAVI